MHIKLRAKAGGRLEVTDDQGNPVKNVISVGFHCSAGGMPEAHVVLQPEVVLDVEAKTVIEHQAATAPVIPQPQGGRRG